MSIILKWDNHQSIIWILEFIRKRPGMYYGKEKNIIYFDIFLAGFDLWMMFSHWSNQDSSLPKDKNLFDQLKEYIIIKYQQTFPDVYFYDKLLLLASGNDPEKAFNLFFELFDEFKKEKWIVYEWDNPVSVVSDEEKNIN